MLAGEGSAVMTDAAGGLLFYTDGKTVWNSKHYADITGLKGHGSSTQTALIIPVPETQCSRYFIFTVGAVEDFSIGANICLVEVSGNSSSGTTIKKIEGPTRMYSASVTEKLNGVKDGAGGYWIVNHEWQSNKYHSYHVTKNTTDIGKVLATDITTSIGKSQTGTLTNGQGQLKFSRDGKKMAIAVAEDKFVEFYDFNLTNGKISNVQLIQNNDPAFPSKTTIFSGSANLYGLEFSNSGELLYIGEFFTGGNASLFQFDLSSGNLGTIRASVTTLATSSHSSRYPYGAFQMGVDGKIWIARTNRKFLGVIASPDIKGTSCNFIDNGVTLIKECYNGLPTTISVDYCCSIPKPYLGRDTAICKGQQVVLKDTVKNVSSYLWSNKATGSSISVWDTGTYWVEISNGSCKQRDTIHIAFKTAPVADLGKDTSLCEGQPKTLTCKQTGLKYVWNTSESTQSITVTKPGKYWVEVDLNGCKDSDTLPISFHNMPKPKLGKDTLLCEGTPLRLKGLTSNATSYQWNTGNNLPDQDVNTAGNYVVTVSDNLCTLSDTIRVDFIPLPKIDLGRDTAFCGDYSLTLDAGNPAMNKIWYNSLTNQSVVINNHFGWVWVEVSNQGCKKRDSLFIKKLAGPTLNLGRDTIYCHPISRWLDAQNPGMNYVWMDGSQNQTLLATSPGKYWVQVRDKAACLFSDTILLADSSFQFNLGADTTLCFGARLMLIGKGPGYAHTWSIGSSSTDLLVEKAGIYSVVIGRGPCVKKDSILISYRKQLALALRPDTGLCDDLGESLLLKAQTGFKNYHWSPGNETTEQIVILKPGVYSVKVSDSYDCEAMASINVLKICPMNVWVPTAFSPGTSGPNSRFGIAYQGPAAEGFEMLIFNRWGELIYKSTDILGSWDGNYLNQPCQLGMYMCIIRFSALYGNEKKRYAYEGMFYLNR